MPLAHRGGMDAGIDLGEHTGMSDVSMTRDTRPGLGPSGTLVLVAILVVAAALRVWGIAPDLPYVFHPDEPVYIAIIQNIFKTGDLNPHWFSYPSFLFYLNALAYVPYYWIGKMIGVFHRTADILPVVRQAVGTAFAPTPSAVLLSRLVTAAVGTGAVVIAFLVGRRLTGRVHVGLLAAAMLAVSPTNVIHSRIIWPGAFVVFWSLVALLGAVRVYKEGNTRDYVLAGVGIGMTAASKYNAAMVVVCLLTAVVLREGLRGLRDRRTFLALGVAALAFFATTPFAIFDPYTFAHDVVDEAQHYSRGHAGMEGNSAAWYLSFLAREETVPALLGLLAMIYGAIRRSKEVLLLSVFPVIYFLFISRFVVRNDRTILHLLPFLYLLGSMFLVEMWQKTSALRPEVRRMAALGVILPAGALAIVMPLRLTVAKTLENTRLDSRTTARLWILGHLPPGSRIAIESYAPYIDPQRYAVRSLYRAIDKDPGWYADSSYRYLVVSEGSYGRFFRDRERYGREAGRYDSLFARWPLVRRFTDGGYEMRIYEVTRPQTR